MYNAKAKLATGNWRPAGRDAKVYDNILHVIGNTPLVKLNRIPKENGLECEIYAKCEFLNPGGSIKDRMAYAMVVDAKNSGWAHEGTRFVEPTSGNTGIGLAMTAAIKGYKATIVTPDKNSDEKLSAMRLLGADIVQTPSSAKAGDPDYFVTVARRLVSEDPKHSIMLDQYSNLVNPLTHTEHTGREILDELGHVDMAVMGAGTGGTVTGVACVLKRACPDCLIVAVDPRGSTIFGNELAPYFVEGIGGDFVPDVLNKHFIDKVEAPNDYEAFNMAREIIRKEGLLCGGSSGSAMFAALKAAKELKLGADKKVVVVLPDGIRNYMTKFVCDQWMEAHLFKEPPLHDKIEWWNHPLSNLDVDTTVPLMKHTATCREALAAMGGKHSVAIVIEDNGVYPLKPQVRVPKNPVISNLNTILHDIYIRYIALKDKDFKKYYNVFETIFFALHGRMKEADLYYKHYSSTVQFAGSHYDHLRINKPDEFDMNTDINLPVDTQVNPSNPSKSDVVIEPISPGFVQLKMGTQFRNLPNRGADWEINKTAYDWLDSENYLLRSLFMNWFRSVVDKAMNTFDEAPNGRPYMDVDGIPYTLRLSASGPAITLIIEDTSRGFRLDVDLVPAIKFPEDRYPTTRRYRRVPKRCKKESFVVVPKPMKGRKRVDTDRSWRLGMHLQEKDLMYDTMHMKQAIRLIKKLRDSLGMDEIASYYIKTMFFHEAIEHDHDPDFWSRNSPADLFIIMVKKFYDYLMDKNIPYFWNEANNLIGDIHESILVGYANKLKKLIQVLKDPSQYKLVAKFLLTESQFKEYNKKFLHI